ncbi:hypothetical protein [Enhydrobacter sp.]|uniref:hypothetical protein n=1 Tax=Enhydrobacter sp. TaxID=1894999 RepID=UPI002609CE10|nr:hypothetical protein [Enhydrobacter sp.]WIM12919.1 MAG: hypothetical protein OJF58_003882 [Enhydrobacter sp.]
MISVDSDARAASYRRMADEIAAGHGRANIAHEQRCNRIDADRKTSAEQKAALRKTSNYQCVADRTVAQSRAEKDHLSRVVPSLLQEHDVR